MMRQIFIIHRSSHTLAWSTCAQVDLMGFIWALLWPLGTCRWTRDVALWITALSWRRGLCNSMKLWALLCRVTQNKWVIVGSSDKTCSTGGGNGKPLQYSSQETPWTVWKGKKIWHQKMSPPGQKVSNMLLGKSGGQLRIAPERMKRLSQSGNSTQLRMYLVMKVKSDAVRTILHRNLEC